MSKLTPVDYEKVVKALTNIGYVVNNQKGSHIVMRLSEKEKYNSLFGCRKNEIMVVVPAHKPIGKGMLRTIIKEVDLSVDEFNELNSESKHYQIPETAYFTLFSCFSGFEFLRKHF